MLNYPGDPKVLAVSSRSPWVAAIGEYAETHGGVDLRGFILDIPGDLGGAWDVLLVDETNQELILPIRRQLQADGRKIIGFWPADRGQVPADLEGYDRMLVETATAATIMRAIAELTDSDAPIFDYDLPSEPQEAAPGLGGRVVAVTGDGSREICVGMAAALGARRKTRPVGLIDADMATPYLGQRLAAREHDTVVDLVSAVTRLRSGDDTPPFGETAHGFDLLCGIGHPDAWSRVAPADVATVVDAARRDYRWVIVDTDDRIDSSSRAAVARIVHADADVVVVGMAASPVGVTRTVNWVVQLREFSDAPLFVVVNRHYGRRSWASELAEEVDRTIDAAAVVTVPFDRRVLHAAWQGELATGRAAKAYARLAGCLGAGTGSDGDSE